jgi:hypothetical protein
MDLVKLLLCMQIKLSFMNYLPHMCNHMCLFAEQYNPTSEFSNSFCRYLNVAEKFRS